MFLYIIGRRKAIGSKTEGVAWSDALGWQFLQNSGQAFLFLCKPLVICLFLSTWQNKMYN